MKVRMDDGTEVEGKLGDTAIMPPGHDIWVVGDNHMSQLNYRYEELC